VIRIAVEAATLLHLPQPDSDLGGPRPICAKEEQLQLEFLQPIELSHHRCPSALNQRSQQSIELEKVLADTVSEDHSVVEATRSTALITGHLALLNPLVPIDFVDEGPMRLTHDLQARQRHLDQLPFDESHEPFVGVRGADPRLPSRDARIRCVARAKSHDGRDYLCLTSSVLLEYRRRRRANERDRMRPVQLDDLVRELTRGHHLWRCPGAPGVLQTHVHQRKQ
jgi:hypothetical protein